MRADEVRETARQMIRMHGLRAQAVAQERVAQMRATGDAAETDRWEAIQTMIWELKRAARRRVGKTGPDNRPSLA